MSLPTLGRLLLANTMIENYITYLKFLDEKFNRFFKKQPPFICCKKGCGRCCKNAQFPYTQIKKCVMQELELNLMTGPNQ